MGVDQEGYFGMKLAERTVRRQRHLHEVAHAAHIDEHLIRSFFSEPSAKLANHRSPVLPLFFRPSTQSRTSAAVSANEFGWRQDVSLHGALNVGLGRACFEIQFHVERVQLEEIAVRLARGRTRTPGNRFAASLSALARAARKLRRLRYAFRKFSRS